MCALIAQSQDVFFYRELRAHPFLEKNLALRLTPGDYSYRIFLMNKCLLFLILIFLCFLISPSLTFAEIHNATGLSRKDIIRQSLDDFEKVSHSQKQFLLTKTSARTRKERIVDKSLREYLGFNQNILPTIGIQTGYIKGDTTYRITFSGGESELEFPLDTTLLGVNLGVKYLTPEERRSYAKEKVNFSISWFTDIYHEGIMKDSDWIAGDGHPGLDIYSESSTDINLTMVDVNCIYKFLHMPLMDLGVMAGYKYHKYNYEVFDTDQTGYGPYHPAYTGYFSGSTIAYSVRYNIPYVGVASDISLTEKLLLALKVGYSPWATSKDRDDHLLRYKMSTSECDGEAFFGSVDGSLSLAPDWHLNLGVEYMDIDTEGTQQQYFYAGPFAGTSVEVDDAITSSYWLAFLSILYSI